MDEGIARDEMLGDVGLRVVEDINGEIAKLLAVFVSRKGSVHHSPDSELGQM